MEAAHSADPDASPPPSQETEPDAAAGRAFRPFAHWVENDGLLRDEGVLFGYAVFHMGEDAQMLEAKLDAIAQAYSGHLDAEQSTLDALDAERERVLAERDAARADEAEQTALARTPHVRDFDPYAPAAAHQRLRVAAPGLAALVGAVLLGWLVYALISRAGLEYQLPVALALTLLGFAGSFQPISVLHARHDVLRSRPDHAEMWKIHVSEWLLPLVTAVLVSVLAYPAFGLPLTFAASLFLFVAFAVVGRYLSSMLTHFAIARRRGREEAEEQRIAAEARADAAARSSELREREAGCVQRLAAIEAEHKAARERLSVVRGRIAYKQSLFVSEYRFGLWTKRAKYASYDDHAPDIPPPASPGDGAPPAPGAGFDVDPDGTAHPRPEATRPGGDLPLL